VGLKRDPFSLGNRIKELLERKSMGSGLEKRDYSRRGSAADYATPLYAQKLALTSSSRGGRSGGIIRLQTKVTELLVQKEGDCKGYLAFIFIRRTDYRGVEHCNKKYSHNFSYRDAGRICRFSGSVSPNVT
jgi:hypothetical protein